MNKKIYFIISSIIQIITSLYALTKAKELAASLENAARIFYSNMHIENLFAQISSTYIIVLALICIFLNSLIIYFVTSDNLLKNKGKIIACSVITFFTATYPIVELLAAINIVIMATSKRINPEDFPDKKAKLPDLAKESIDNHKIILAIMLIILYFSQFIWSKFIPQESSIKMIVSTIFYLLMIVLSLTFFKDLLKNNLQVFKKHFKPYFQNLLPLIGKYYLFYLLVALIAAFLAKEITSVNQDNIMKLPLWYSAPLAIIYAPIVEETIFRGCLRRFIANDHLFIIVSALAFGLLHTAFSEATLYNTLVMSLPYMTMGGFMAYLYTKTNNILCNMSFHCFHNTIALIILSIIKL